MSSKGRKIAKNLGKSLRKKFDSDSQTDDLQQVGKPIPWHVKNLPVWLQWGYALNLSGSLILLFDLYFSRNKSGSSKNIV